MADGQVRPRAYAAFSTRSMASIRSGSVMAISIPTAPRHPAPALNSSSATIKPRLDRLKHFARFRRYVQGERILPF
jgi:hypothetical protein